MPQLFVMKYSEINGVNKKVSKIFCGTACAPYNKGGNCNALLNDVLALGVNAFDTARVYGGAENALGRWIAECGVRDKIVLLSKCCHPNIFGMKRVNVRAMRADLKKSLSILNTNYIDIYLLHRDDVTVPVGPIVEELNALYAEGKIGAFGASNWSHERIAQANEYAAAHSLIPYAVTSPNFSAAEQLCDVWGGGVSISGREGLEARRWYADSGMAVVAYSSLARGLFSGRVVSGDPASCEVLDKFARRGYLSEGNIKTLSRIEKIAAERGATVAQIALAYVLCCPFNGFAVVSCSRASRMQENAAAAGIELSAEEVAFIEGV